MTEPPFGELLVVELDRQVAAGYCGLLFGRLGATIVSVGPPGSRESNDELSAGKKSITLDAARPEGAALLRRLAAQADVLLADDSLLADLDYASLSAQNPRLVMTCVTNSPDSDGAQRFIGLNAFAATLLPLITMSVLGRGERIEVDGGECIAAAAMLVDGDGESFEPHQGPSAEVPFRVEGVLLLDSAPQSGRHNDEVYRGLLGLTDEEMARLRREAIV
ncbi:MAG: CoA transferase [Dehalococcoidia bacterium]|jgi:crotonobetainyl-CoA:carnitine CoA-transferase CaiB-like acyl-CoA transferase